MNGSMPDFAHIHLAHAEYLVRGSWSTWQMQMRIWRPQDYVLWGGMLLATAATLRTLFLAK
jgi:hypothetical protein